MRPQWYSSYLRFLTAICCLALLIGLAAPAGLPAQAQKDSPLAPGLLDAAINVPRVGEAVRPVVFNGDLRNLPNLAASPSLPLRPLLEAPLLNAGPAAPDPVVQSVAGSGLNMPSPVQNFAGMNLSANGAGWPPDTVGDVGPNHYIQLVNTSIGIYTKTGTQLYVNTLNGFFSAGAAPCNGYNKGDVVVLYDHLADRWIVTDFAWTSTANPPVGPFYECIAVSQTGDPVSGGWYFYTFQTHATYMADYPKLAVWPDAYYMSANMFNGNTYAGTRIWALDRASMLVGGPLNNIYGDLGTGYFTALPSNLEGPPPPAGSPNYFLSVPSYTSINYLNLLKFHVDWVTPANSTITGPYPLGIALGNILCNGNRNCIPQQGTTQALDSISHRLMMQVQYRISGGVESLWATHTLDAGSSRAGVRWYEIRNPSSGPWVYQQGTYAPADGLHRWMAALAADRQGNLAVGYSASSSSLYPSIYYTGRLASDALNSLPQAEATLIAGSGYQTTYNRWGDYSGMSVDPSDDCTFWYTNEYYATSGTNWQTRIGAFKFPSCDALKYWVGGTSTSWNDGSNWSPAGVPAASDNVVIDTAHQTTYWPVVDANAQAFDLTIDTGAQLGAAAGFTLQVFGNWKQNGTGFFNPAAGSTVALVGSPPNLAAATPSDSNHFANLTIGDGTRLPAVALQTDLRVDGNLTVQPGGRLNAGSHTITVKGNFTVNAGGTFDPGTGTVYFAGAAQTISSFTAGASYTAVRATDSFEGTWSGSPASPSGWTQQVLANPSGSAPAWQDSSTPTSHPNPGVLPGGTKAARFNSYTAEYGDMARLKTSASFATSGAALCRARFQMYHDAGFGNFDTVQVEASTDGTNFSGVGTPIMRYDGTTGWKEHTVYLPYAFTNQPAVYLAFKGASDYGNDEFIDLATVECAAPLAAATPLYNATVNPGSVTTLGTPLAVAHDLTVSALGKLDLDTNALTVENTLTNNGTLQQRAAAVPGGSTTEFLHIRNLAASADKYHGVDITPAGAMGNTTVAIQGNQAACTTVPSDPLITRCFTITPGAAQNATVRFWYTEAERHSQLANLLTAWHYSGPPTVWTPAGSGFTNSEAGGTCASGGGLACWMEASGVTSYSPFGLGSGGAPTVVALTGLQAQSHAGGLAGMALLAGLLIAGLAFRRRKD